MLFRSSYGVEGFYQEFGDEYCNPDEATIRSALRRAHSRWQVDTTHVLDLACGSGEVTLALRQLGYPRIEGIDPHTGAAYQDRTGQPARALSFEQIAAGALITVSSSGHLGSAEKNPATSIEPESPSSRSRISSCCSRPAWWSRRASPMGAMAARSGMRLQHHH